MNGTTLKNKEVLGGFGFEGKLQLQTVIGRSLGGKGSSRHLEKQREISVLEKSLWEPLTSRLELRPGDWMRAT